eukprot:g65134.t1
MDSNEKYESSRTNQQISSQILKVPQANLDTGQEQPSNIKMVTSTLNSRLPVRSLSSDDLSLSDRLLANEAPQVMTPAFTVKLAYDGDTRRLKLKSKTVNEAIQNVKKCFGLKPRQFTMCYKDEEGDMVAVYLDQELNEAFEVAEAENKILKLFVEPVDSPSSSNSSSNSSQSVSSNRSTVVHASRSFYTSSGSSGTSSDTRPPSDTRRDQRKQWREKRDANFRIMRHPHPLARGGQPDTQREERERLSESTRLALKEATAAAAAERVAEAQAAAAAREANNLAAKYSPAKSNLVCKMSDKTAACPAVVANKRTATNAANDGQNATETTVGRLTHGSSWNGAWVSRTYKAKFIKDLNLPDRSQVKPSQTLIKTWQLHNSGTVQWPRGTGVKLFRSCTRTVSGRQDTEHADIVDPNSRFPVQAATPGQTVDVSVILTTPPSEGRCRAFFRLVTDENQFFGPRMWLDIDVVYPPPPEMAGEPAGPVDAECDEVNEATGRDLCEEFELLRNATADEAINEDELYASSNPGSKAGSERSESNSE